MAGEPVSFFGLSATIASVVTRRPATELASCKATLTTLAGSMMPFVIRSPYSPVWAIKTEGRRLMVGHLADHNRTLDASILGDLANRLSFPKIISGHIGGAVQPGLEWQGWRQSVGLLDEKAHLSVMPGACALDCNTPHRRKELAAGAPRRRSALDPGTRSAMCRSDVLHSHSATVIQERSVDRGYPWP
jgi:hypothetical protein